MTFCSLFCWYSHFVICQGTFVVKGTTRSVRTRFVEPWIASNRLYFSTHFLFSFVLLSKWLAEIFRNEAHWIEIIIVLPSIIPHDVLVLSVTSCVVNKLLKFPRLLKIKNGLSSSSTIFRKFNTIFVLQRFFDLNSGLTKSKKWVSPD